MLFWVIYFIYMENREGICTFHLYQSSGFKIILIVWGKKKVVINADKAKQFYSLIVWPTLSVFWDPYQRASIIFSSVSLFRHLPPIGTKSDVLLWNFSCSMFITSKHTHLTKLRFTVGGWSKVDLSGYVQKLRSVSEITGYASTLAF